MRSICVHCWNSFQTDSPTAKSHPHQSSIARLPFRVVQESTIRWVRESDQASEVQVVKELKQVWSLHVARGLEAHDEGCEWCKQGFPPGLTPSPTLMTLSTLIYLEEVGRRTLKDCFTGHPVTSRLTPRRPSAASSWILPPVFAAMNGGRARKHEVHISEPTLASIQRRKLTASKWISDTHVPIAVRYLQVSLTKAITARTRSIPQRGPVSACGPQRRPIQGQSRREELRAAEYVSEIAEDATISQIEPRRSRHLLAKAHTVEEFVTVSSESPWPFCRSVVSINQDKH